MIQRLALLLAAIGAFAITAAPSARADENGIKVGDGRLHPYFDLETRYDTAAQLGLNSDGTSKTFGDLILHFRPGIKLDVPSPTFAVQLGANVEYLVYTGLSTSTASQLNRFQAESNLDIGILRGQPISFELGDHLTRSDQTTNLALTYGVLSLYNDARVAAVIAPGGGSLSISPGYHLGVEAYSKLTNVVGTTGPAPADPGTFNYLNHRFTLENRWRFLPKTAVLLDGEYSFRSYTNASGGTNISYLKATTGLTGLLTPHISATFRIGYGRDMTTGSFSSVIGQLEGTYLFNETTSLRLGVLRNFEPVQLPFVTYENDRGYVEGKILVMSRLTLHAYASADLLPFRGAISRNDLNLGLNFGGDYEVTRWLVVAAGNALYSRSSDQKIGSLNFTDDQIYLRLTFQY